MEGWSFKILYDGKCPLCRAEIEWLFRRDRKGRLQKEDITDEGFDPATYGKNMDELMGTLHGLFPDGRMISGLDAVIELYRTVGLGWLWRPARLPLIRNVYERAYRWFARNRLRRGKLIGRSCEGDRCRIE